MDWLIVAGGVLVGAVAGGLGAYFLLPRAEKHRAERQARKELEAYREQVAEHFARTAGLINRMTDSYKEVFEHLQSGADRLLDEEQLREKLGHEDGKTITLGRLGYHPTPDRRGKSEPPDAGRQSAAPDDDDSQS